MHAIMRRLSICLAAVRPQTPPCTNFARSFARTYQLKRCSTCGTGLKRMPGANICRLSCREASRQDVEHTASAELHSTSKKSRVLHRLAAVVQIVCQPEARVGWPLPENEARGQRVYLASTTSVQEAEAAMQQQHRRMQASTQYCVSAKLVQEQSVGRSYRLCTETIHGRLLATTCYACVDETGSAAALS